MLVRCSRLRDIIDEFIEVQGWPELSIGHTEWKRIEYIIDLTLPFAEATTTIGTTKGPTIHLVLGYYNTLFDILDIADEKLQHKTEPWQKEIYAALDAAFTKLVKYYTATWERFGDIYGIAILLNPAMKREFWNRDAFSGEGLDSSFEDYYWSRFRNEYARYKPLATSTRVKPKQPSRRSATSFAMGMRSVSEEDDSDDDATPRRPTPAAVRPSTELDEVSRYRNAPFEDLDNHSIEHPLQSWQRIASEYPICALMARDFLCIPAAGTGCERDFSVARHQSRYNRSYDPSTFSSIMCCRSRERNEQQQARDALAEDAPPILSTFQPSGSEVEVQQHQAEADYAAMTSWRRFEAISDNEEPMAPKHARRSARKRKELFSRRGRQT